MDALKTVKETVKETSKTPKIKVTAAKRIGSYGSITTCMREALDRGFEVPVGLGGTLLHKAGKVKVHGVRRSEVFNKRFDSCQPFFGKVKLSRKSHF